MTVYRTHTFDYKSRPEGASKKTNFQLVPSDKTKEHYEAYIRRIQSSIGNQNDKLIPVPVEVDIKTRPREDSFETSKTLSMLTLFIWPAVTDHDTLFDLTFKFPSETILRNERWTKRHLLSWLALPSNILLAPFFDPMSVKDNRTDLVAEEFLSFLSEERYEDSVAAMRENAVQSILQEKPIDLSACRRLLDGVSDQRTIRNMAKKAIQPEVGIYAFERISGETDYSEMAENARTKEVRLSALKKVEDVGALLRLARTSGHAEVRSNAAQLVSDERILSEIAINENEAKIRLDAARRVNDEKLCCDIFRKAQDENVRLVVLGNIASETLLTEAARKDDSAVVRAAAARKIGAENTFAEMAKSDSDSGNRLMAANRIVSPFIASKLLQTATDPEVRLVVLKKIEDEHSLVAAAIGDSDDRVRSNAAARVVVPSNLVVIVKSCPDRPVRIQSLRRIEKTEDRRAAAKSHPDPVVRYDNSLLPETTEEINRTMKTFQPDEEQPNQIGPFKLGMDLFEFAIVAMRQFPEMKIQFDIEDDIGFVMADGQPVAAARCKSGKVGWLNFSIAQTSRLLSADDWQGIVSRAEERFGKTKPSNIEQKFGEEIIREQLRMVSESPTGQFVQLSGVVSEHQNLPKVRRLANAAISDAQNKRKKALEMQKAAKDFCENVDWAILAGADSDALAEARKLVRYYDDVDPLWSIRNSGELGRFGRQLGTASSKDVASAESELKTAMETYEPILKPSSEFSPPGLIVAESKLAASDFSKAFIARRSSNSENGK